MDADREVKFLIESEERAEKLFRLLRMNLVDREHVNEIIVALRKQQKDKALSPQQKDLLIGLLNRLTDMLTSDTTMFNRAKSLV